MTKKVPKYTVMVAFIGILAVSVIVFTARMSSIRTVVDLPFRWYNGEIDLSKLHLVLEILDRPAMRDTIPAAKEISWEEYCRIKAGYAQKNEAWKPGYVFTYRRKEGDDWRKYWLALESFNDDTAWLAELTQYKSKGWDWVARYQLKRNPELDKEFRILQILKERSQVLGGVKYGMSVKEVIAKKGRHYKINHHAEGGSADLVYDDVKVSIRGWWSDREGRVVGVEPTTTETWMFLKDVPYEDEK